MKISITVTVIQNFNSSASGKQNQIAAPFLVSAYIIAAASAQNWLLIAIVIVATGLSLVKKIHPLWVMLFGAVSGALFL